ncbi:hypothetical protein [Rhodococcoides fascians]|uniref:hypothetical protein n=1 Tax=Rhodococcoides fascians TaxID=1828 RepID=UPI002781C8C7|nr:hypothetical protein [Rhodococcus fascians]MDQ0283752.1 hypothetical protein [Rhodococcus fascians]
MSMKVTREQFLELLADDSHPDAVWIMNEDRTTEIVVPTADELEQLQAHTHWPMYLVRVDHAENYVREHGLDGAVAFLNLTFLLNPEPGTLMARAATLSGRVAARLNRPAQEGS